MISTGSRFSVGFPVVEENALARRRELYAGRLEVYGEFLDIIRFPSERYQRVFQDYLRDKYASDAPDLVILIYVENLRVAENLLEKIFPRTPVVPVGLTEEEFPTGSLGDRTTGVAQRSAPGGTMELMLRLPPEIQRIVLIGDTSQVDREVMSRARQALRTGFLTSSAIPSTRVDHAEPEHARTAPAIGVRCCGNACDNDARGSSGATA